MKTIKIKILATAMLLTAFLFTGCKKEAGPAGAAGPIGPQGPVLTLNSAGFVTGTLTGMRQDGTPFTEPFSYTYYFPGNSGRLDSLSTTSYGFFLSRSTNDIFSNNNASLNVNTTSKTASTGSFGLNLTFEKSLGTNKRFYFSTFGTATTTATGLSYNASTGVFSGNFNVTYLGSQNTSGNSATIVGSFQGIVVQDYNIKHQQGEIIKD